MINSPDWEMWQAKKFKSSTKGKVHIQVGNKTWTIYSFSDQAYAELAACLEAIAPLSCGRKDRDNDYEYEYEW